MNSWLFLHSLDSFTLLFSAHTFLSHSFTRARELTMWASNDTTTQVCVYFIYKTILMVKLKITKTLQALRDCFSCLCHPLLSLSPPHGSFNFQMRGLYLYAITIPLSLTRILVFNYISMSSSFSSTSQLISSSLLTKHKSGVCFFWVWQRQHQQRYNQRCIYVTLWYGNHKTRR